jgi:hypothetical protein
VHDDRGFRPRLRGVLEQGEAGISGQLSPPLNVDGVTGARYATQRRQASLMQQHLLKNYFRFKTIQKIGQRRRRAS